MKSLKISFKASCCRCRRNGWILKQVLLITHKKFCPKGAGMRDGIRS